MDDYLNLSVSFQFSGSIGFKGVNDFLSEVHATLTLEDGTVIGKVVAYQLLFERAIEASYSHLEIWDSTAPLFEIAGEVYDFDTNELSEEVVEMMHGDIFTPNILVIDRIMVLPEYRGRSIGTLFLQETIARLGNFSSCVILKAFPLQLESKINLGKQDKFESKLGLDKFPSDEVGATTALGAYYEKLGFLHFKNGIYLMNLGQQNPIDKIRYEDLFEI